MKKNLLLTLFASALILGACGSESAESEPAADTEETETTDDTTEETATETEETEESEEVASEETAIEFNQELETDDKFTATLQTIEHIVDEEWDEEKYEVTFDVTNNSEESLEFQARSVAINGRMVDESLLMMSQEVAPGNSAYAVLTIQDYEGGELPELTGNFEMSLYAFSWDNMDYEYEAPVSVSLDQ
ncbi:hypothetical protein FEZ48_02655 [Marinilactibacillus psychrotolerans]|uniref:DUF4352 domain-containing protein n=1 Tax=Marinilactibacillus psychrotolerans TaxID=191770 RepID=A0A5R9C6P7_9LACT|nr:hypothetical protein [Marinilactibacillus psychrotolerans]TLQ08803.1 hypothetical protein FEZ48_02655 [Marinilactibacillus psychrotolerans]